MATRGTYQFRMGGEIRTNTFFYVHWDNYPVGGAVKLLNALSELKANSNNSIENRWRGNLAEAFVRSNIDAEITFDHDSHSDTDYMYTIRNFKRSYHVTVLKRSFVGENFNAVVETYFEGYLNDFVKNELSQYKDEEEIKNQWLTVFGEDAQEKVA